MPRTFPSGWRTCADLHLVRREGPTLTSPAVVTALTTAQTLFSVALGVMTLLITWFGLYVVWSTTWSDRWVRKSPPKGDK